MSFIDKITGRAKPKAADCAVEVAPTAPHAAHFQALRAKVQQLKLKAGEQRRAGSRLRTELEALGKKRVGVMAAAKLNNDPGTGALRAVEDEIEHARQAVKDADELAAEFEEMARQFATELNEAEGAARVEMGEQLDRMFAAAATRYQEAAGVAAESALALLAVKETMISMGCGNSNGFDGYIRLPLAKPGDGKTLAPIIDTRDPGFQVMVRKAKEKLIPQLIAAGFEV